MMNTIPLATSGCTPTEQYVDVHMSVSILCTFICVLEDIHPLRDAKNG